MISGVGARSSLTRRPSATGAGAGVLAATARTCCSAVIASPIVRATQSRCSDVVDSHSSGGSARFSASALAFASASCAEGIQA